VARDQVGAGLMHFLELWVARDQVGADLMHFLELCGA
jgi:hypothetical protein